MPEPRLQGGFDLPFKEQAEFLRNKLDLPTDTWQDVMHGAHDRAFVVAGAAKADLLADLHAAVQKAIDQGTSLETFRKDFRAIVAKHGWVDFTGSGTPGGFAWRTKVIYETNLRSSYAAGRYTQLTDPEFRKARPLWRYIHADGVLHPRPLHVAWHGKVIPADDPWWKTHFPPNGWGCKCRVHAIAPDQLGKYGKDAPDAAPDDGETTWTDNQGVEHTTPRGIDPGWGYAPGANTTTPLRQFVQDKLITYPEAISKALSRDVTRYINATEAPAEFVRRALSDRTLTDPLWLGFPGAAAADISDLVGSDISRFTLLLPAQTPRHVAKSHGHDDRAQRPAEPEDYSSVAAMLDHPDELHPGEHSADGLVRFVAIKRFGGELWRGVFEVRPGKRNRSINLITLIIKR